MWFTFKAINMCIWLNIIDSVVTIDAYFGDDNIFLVFSLHVK